MVHVPIQSRFLKLQDVLDLLGSKTVDVEYYQYFTEVADINRSFAHIYCSQWNSVVIRSNTFTNVFQLICVQLDDSMTAFQLIHILAVHFVLSMLQATNVEDLIAMVPQVLLPIYPQLLDSLLLLSLTESLQYCYCHFVLERIMMFLPGGIRDLIDSGETFVECYMAVVLMLIVFARFPYCQSIVQADFHAKLLQTAALPPSAHRR